MTTKSKCKCERITIFELVKECEAKHFTKYIFNHTDKNKTLNISTTFDRICVLHTFEHLLYLGEKNHHITLSNVLYVEVVSDCDIAKIYKVVCQKNKRKRIEVTQRKQIREYEIIAVE